MNTAQIKAYAPRARTDFIKAVTERAARFGIHGDNKFDSMEFKGDVAIIGTQVFTKKGGELREKLVKKVKQQGFEMFIRSHAYTWFNRFVAIRYMELHDFLDHGFRVLSHPNGSDIPEILEHATEVYLPGLDKEKVMELRLAGDKDNELYRMLVIAQCNALHKAMPFLFEAIDNEVELLLPDNLLHTHSPVRKMVTQIDGSLWTDVEIIGWIYQFYISEKKDEVIGKVVKSEDIPAATQLFTPNWIVKYMVQNTLGKMWMATYPDSSLKTKMEYYIEPAEQEPEVQEEIDRTTPKELNPEELTFLDPACGSGHILVEAYDILKEIYLERGYRTRDIPRLILKNNLYGLDIDDRAAQLACFAVLMRARKDDRRLFNRDGLSLNIMSIVETKGFDKDKLLNAVSKREGGKGVWIWIHELVELFECAKTFGSLITIPDELTAKLDEIKDVIDSDLANSDDVFNYIAGTELKILRPVTEQALLLAKKYDCVVANPPYMGGKGMNPKIKSFLKDNYTDVKSDLFSAFIVRNTDLTLPKGQLGFMSPFVWMFISSYEKLRGFLINQKTITSLVQLEYSGFDGATVPICTFTIENAKLLDYQGGYIRLSDFRGAENQGPKTIEAINTPHCSWFYRASAIDFKKIPGIPIAFWPSTILRDCFTKHKSLSEIAKPKQGLATMNNNRFLRFWFECSWGKIDLTAKNHNDVISSKATWFPIQKGGGYRKWYGNNDYVVNWKNNGAEIKEIVLKRYGSISKRIVNEHLYFKQGTTWSSLSSSSLSMRYVPSGFLFETKGSMCFFEKEYTLLGTLAFCNSNIVNPLLQCISPTLDFHEGPIGKLPIISDINSTVIDYTKQAISISKNDWDSSELSWDFIIHSLLKSKHQEALLEESYITTRNEWKNSTFKIRQLEEENNQSLLKTYELKNELKHNVPLSEITLTCNPYYRFGSGKTEKEYENLLLIHTIKDLISYSIGCMMGRYNLDEQGLIYAHSKNERFDSSKYRIFPADDDGIVPIMDMDWFEDDATKRFIEFIKTAWPEEHLDENLRFIADSLNSKANELPEGTIRRYLSTTFFKDHMKTYKKRPIYWLFSSGKQKAFECLVYLHRYNDSTLSRMRSNYVTPLQGNISARIEFLEHEKDATTTASTQKKIQKQIDILKKKQVELKNFDDELRHYADMKISIDLDDGVKVNYGKFGNLLAEKKAITGEK